MNRDPSAARREAEQRLADAVRRRGELKQALAGRSGPPVVGDVFLFPGAALLAFRWAAILKHPDRPMLFVVPADTAPFVGSADVEVAQQERGGPMVLRCASGLWVEESAFRQEQRVAWLERRYLDRAQAKLEQVARGRLDGTAGQRETDASPAYDDWVEQVGAAVEDLRTMLRDRRVTVSLKEDCGVIRFPDPLLDASQAEMAAPQFHMAAAPELADLLKGVGPEETRGVELLYPCPGQLFLAPAEAGVGVRYLAIGGEEPPLLAAIQPDGQAVAVGWRHTSNGRVWWANVGWTEERVTLRLGSGDEAREITVEP